MEDAALETQRTGLQLFGYGSGAEQSMPQPLAPASAAPQTCGGAHVSAQVTV
jgi:hypothetical protein